MKDKALMPVTQKEVVFYEDVVTAVLVEVDSRQEIYVPVWSVCDYLGVDWSAQYRRINRDPVLSESIKGVAITPTPSAEGRGGGQQEMLCLPLKFLPGWLFSISASRVKPEHKDKASYPTLKLLGFLGRASTDKLVTPSGWRPPQALQPSAALSVTPTVGSSDCGFTVNMFNRF